MQRVFLKSTEGRWKGATCAPPTPGGRFQLGSPADVPEAWGEKPEKVPLGNKILKQLPGLVRNLEKATQVPGAPPGAGYGVPPGRTRMIELHGSDGHTVLNATELCTLKWLTLGYVMIFTSI